MGVRLVDEGAELALDPKVGAKVEELVDRLDTDMALTVSQGIADIAGVFDPTPVSDIVGGVLSLVSGDFAGAGLSAVSLVPYVGDALGKTTKFAKLFKTIDGLNKRLETLKNLFKVTAKHMDPKTAARIRKQLTKLDFLKKKWQSKVKSVEDKIKGILGKSDNKGLLEDAKEAVGKNNTASCAKKHQKKTIEGDEYKGGAHKNNTGKENRQEGTYAESNHMPADSVSPIKKSEGGAIQMDSQDHAMIATTGSSLEAQAWREVQKEMIDKGHFWEAVDMDIEDVRSKFGDKYADAIEQMKDYYKNIDLETN